MAAQIKLNEGTGHLAVGVGGVRTTIKYAFTVAAGFSTALYVSTNLKSATPTSATYNGASFTNMSGLTYNGYDSEQWWVLFNPTVGTYDIEFVYPINQSSGFTVICLDGVDQTAAVIDDPHQTVASTGTGPNTNSWCGDLSTRAMYMITAGYANSSVPSFVYDTGLNSFFAFGSRSLPTNEFTETETNYTGDGIGIAGWGRLAAGSSWKTTITTNWSGTPPSHAITYLFINETLLDPTTVQMIII